MIVADLATQYGDPGENPNSMRVFQSSLGPSEDDIFDRYIQELGGAEQLANFNSFAATGTYVGYETGHLDVPVEMFAEAPNRITTIKTDSVRVYNGNDAWITSENFPIPLMPLTGGNLVGLRVMALVAFPATLQEEFDQWRVGTTIIDDRDIQVVQGTGAGEFPVNLYFDPDSGLLERVLYWTQTPLGTVPIQVDYTDYREVTGVGVRMPFQWTETWTTGQITTQLTEVRPNVSIDPARFAMP
jgi:outer membrane lipoprotein-sorting protein